MLLELRQARAGGRIGQQQRRHRCVVHEARVRYLARFIDVLEKREQGVEIAHRQGVEFVVVTTGTFQRQAEKRRAEGIHAVHDVANPKLFFDDAALLVLQVETIEGGGQALFGGGVGQQVAGELPGDKPVERHVLVERLDDPVAIWPNRSRRVHLVAVGVGVARQVEPLRSHPFTEPR